MKNILNPVDAFEALGEAFENLSISDWFSSAASPATTNSTVEEPTNVSLVEGFMPSNGTLTEIANNITNTTTEIVNNITNTTSNMDTTTAVGSAAAVVVLGGLGTLLRSAGKNGIDLSKFYADLEKTAEGKQLAGIIKNAAKEGVRGVALKKLTPQQLQLIEDNAQTLSKLGEGAIAYLLNPNKNKVAQEKLDKLAAFKTPEKLAESLPNFADALKTSLKLQKLFQGDLSEKVLAHFKGFTKDDIAELTKALEATHNNVVSNFNNQQTDDDKISYITGVVKGGKAKEEATQPTIGMLDYLSSFFTKKTAAPQGTSTNSSTVSAPASAKKADAPVATEKEPTVTPVKNVVASKPATNQSKTSVAPTQGKVKKEESIPSKVVEPKVKAPKKEESANDNAANVVDYSGIVLSQRGMQQVQMKSLLTAYYNAFTEKQPKQSFARFTAAAQNNFMKDLKLTQDGHLTQESVTILDKMGVLEVNGGKASLKV